MSRYKYWEKISAIADTLKEYDCADLQNESLEVIISHLNAIEIIAHDSTIDFGEAKHILHDERMSEALKIIRKFYVAAGTRLETQNAFDILEAEEPWSKIESFHYYDRYVVLVRNETQLAHLSAGDRMVLIGGGSVPLTSMLLNKFFGVNGICIEKEPEIANLCALVLENLGFSSGIEVVCGDETALSHLFYDVVMVAAVAEPKKKVFENLRRLVPPETKILYRTYSGMRAIQYAPVTEEDLTGFQELGRVLPTGKVNNTSVLIRKELA
ncbi:MAG TPA: nicotianamine synthase family protein [Candidatus Acidoferrales bacterium]|nr:nicotianamine synthase family protein [Candidatus Acidoferrales bacterium]